MLQLGGVAENSDSARRMMEVSISSGSAVEKFREIVAAQGGDPHVVDDLSMLPQAAECEFYTAPRSGVVAHVEPRAGGRGIHALGGGRTRMEDAIDPSVGFVISVRPGDYVKAGEPMATIMARDMAGVTAGMAALCEAILIADEAEHPLPLVSHRVTAAGVERVEA
jgi:thymidine phosphorylase